MTAATLADPVAAACDRIAPTWPLDRFIAVNPYWGWREGHASAAAAWLGALAGTSLTASRSWVRGEWAAGRLAAEHLEAAAGGDAELLAAACAVLDGPDDEPVVRRLALVTDVRELTSRPRPDRTWADLVVHQIGQHAAAHVDRWQGTWHPDRRLDLFASWQQQLAAAGDVGWWGGTPWVRSQLPLLPAEPAAAIDVMLDDLAVPVDGREAYLTALLLSVNGWAAWFAYERWQARLVGGDDHQLVDLLAVRLAWEWLLQRDPDSPTDEATWAAWAASWSDAAELVAATERDQRVDWLLQTAAERAYQAGLVAGLGAAAAPAPSTPTVQAAFCIDVRSEVLRRALEAVAPDVQTRGFAGFFGLPIAYTPFGTEGTRPQLPGLLAPALTVTDEGPAGAALAAERAATLADRRRWQRFRSEPSSVFSFVESTGLIYGAKLVAESLGRGHHHDSLDHEGLPGDAAAALRPRLALVDEDPAAAAALAHRVLRAMGLVEGFAPIVLLCGHGSRTANNPHAAGLDCGACGGQTGEVNARVLADVLNTPSVRAELAALGIAIPDTTWFVPGLHTTTTDQVDLFDTDLVPAPLRPLVAELRDWLAAAGARARAERAPRLGLGDLAGDPVRLEQAVLARAADWSQVRPEWGLAGNASFVVAPRWRTRGLDLGGRAFLHDYDWRLDPDLSVLTLIMTAPMVVTNWINLQYHASTVDNRRYGSGDKVLHNVVGGNIGVFEGNGGDLRIGLAMQSLHDGTTLQHPPLRLSVFIEAPQEAIDTVIAGHQVVQDLVGNGWLHLLRIDPPTGSVSRWTPAGWTRA